jgi:hypothetical protein
MPQNRSQQSTGSNADYGRGNRNTIDFCDIELGHDYLLRAGS